MLCKASHILGSGGGGGVGGQDGGDGDEENGSELHFELRYRKDLNFLETRKVELVGLKTRGRLNNKLKWAMLCKVVQGRKGGCFVRYIDDSLQRSWPRSAHKKNNQHITRARHTRPACIYEVTRPI